jgi:Rps23 Pro-64 3,4-dihydroxylase Tpa1-like proline 4-hydroxylase
MTEAAQVELVGLIVSRLQRDLSTLREAFRAQTDVIPTRACVITSLLPDEVCSAIYQGFPPLHTMRRLSSLRERKYAFKQLRECAQIVEHVTFALQDKRIVSLVEQITGMRDLIPDSRLYAGGISSMVCGDFLNPHIDNSHDAERKLYRRVNLLYYVTPGWTLAHGGNLKLWDAKVQQSVTLASSFNTLVLMETNRRSWHSVDAVRGAGTRCCVSNYYFSEASPDGDDYFHVTDFSAPPEQPLRRLVARVDGRLRTAVRAIKRTGFSRRDFFQ